MPHVIVVYDVSSNKTRLLLAQRLERMGLRRIQRSAFIGRLPAPRVRDLERLIQLTINPQTDVAHIFKLDNIDWKKTTVIGTPQWAAGAPENTVITT